MKKFGKCLAGLVGIAAIGAGAYYAYKKFVAKDVEDDDFDDDLDDFDFDDDEEENSTEYVSLNIDGEEAVEDIAEAAEDAFDEVKDAAEDAAENIKDAFD